MGNLDFSCERFLKEAKELAPFLGLPIKSPFKSDKGTHQYLMGLKYSHDVYSSYWGAKILFWVNGKRTEKWIQANLVKPINVMGSQI